MVLYYLKILLPYCRKLKPRVSLDLISNEKVRTDFQEAIKSYNNGIYNGCMMLARRAIQQEMDSLGYTGKNLYKQIEGSGISDNLKSLLQKVKTSETTEHIQTSCLYDENKKELTDIQEFARLSLEFIDRYFADAYEIKSLVAAAPGVRKR